VPRYEVDDIDQRDLGFITKIAETVGPALRRYFRTEVRGLERIADGAGLFVGNHNGGVLTPDTFIFCSALYEHSGAASLPYGLGHQIVITTPGLRHLVVPMGGVHASHENAHRLFERGEKVLVYPGGDLDTYRPFADRNRIVFGGRKGYVRLALREGVPIYPVVAAGAHSGCIVLTDGRSFAKRVPFMRRLRLEVWPVVLSFPWGLTPFPAPPYLPPPGQILIEVLEAIHFDRSGQAAADDQEYVDECDHRIREAMQATLTRLAAERETQKKPWFSRLRRARS
jgi:1-acyl-sn-glycerol-3-phosphate acyltransferase